MNFSLFLVCLMEKIGKDFIHEFPVLSLVCPMVGRYGWIFCLKNTDPPKVVHSTASCVHFAARIVLSFHVFYYFKKEMSTLSEFDLADLNSFTFHIFRRLRDWEYEAVECQWAHMPDEEKEIYDHFSIWLLVRSRTVPEVYDIINLFVLGNWNDDFTSPALKAWMQQNSCPGIKDHMINYTAKLEEYEDLFRESFL